MSERGAAPARDHRRTVR